MAKMNRVAYLGEILESVHPEDGAVYGVTRADWKAINRKAARHLIKVAKAMPKAPEGTPGRWHSTVRHARDEALKYRKTLVLAHG